MSEEALVVGDVEGVVGIEPVARSTRARVLDAALSSFGTRGYDSTSLDQLAIELGVRKQTILYYYPSKSELLDAVLVWAADDLAVTLARGTEGAGVGFERVEVIVRSVFRMTIRRPELLGILREVTRPGAPAATRFVVRLEPLIKLAAGFLESEMDAGRIRRCDSQLLLLSIYSTVVGVATEVEVLRAVGIEPTLRTTAVRRREVLAFLRAALAP